MTSYADIETTAASAHLAVFGAFHPEEADTAPEGCATLVLLGPAEPGFWPHVSAAPEFADSAPDPMDRWSQREITRIAGVLGATPLFPFAGPPWHPFIGWAKRSGRAWQSPVGLLVHDVAGLMVSYRGALAFHQRIPLPAPPTDAPCATCQAPCRTACPVDALGGASGYNTEACHGYLDTPAGGDCLTRGCAARRACPVSQSYGRLPEQSAFHMRSFHP